MLGRLSKHLRELRILCRAGSFDTPAMRATQDEVRRSQEDLPDPDEPESIEAEDLAGYLTRMCSQPGRSSWSVFFIGRVPTAENPGPRPGTFRLIWWN